MKLLRSPWIWLLAIAVLLGLIWLSVAFEDDSLPTAPGGCGGG